MAEMRLRLSRLFMFTTLGKVLVSCFWLFWRACSGVASVGVFGVNVESDQYLKK
jgi:hypothetical protein